MVFTKPLTFINKYAILNYGKKTDKETAENTGFYPEVYGREFLSTHFKRNCG
jgi:hypothetical protein